MQAQGDLGAGQRLAASIIEMYQYVATVTKYSLSPSSEQRPQIRHWGHRNNGRSASRIFWLEIMFSLIQFTIM